MSHELAGGAAVIEEKFADEYLGRIESKVVGEVDRELEVIESLDGISPLKQYLRTLPKLQPHTLVEDQNLGRMVQRGIEAEQALTRGKLSRKQKTYLEKTCDNGRLAREELINSCLPAVVSIAFRKTGSGVDIMDLVSSGNEGLVRASTRYNPERGFKFVTFAYIWINKTIQDEIVRSSHQIRLSRQIHERVVKMHRVHDEIQNRQVGTKATHAQIMEAMGISRKELQNAESADGLSFVPLFSKINLEDRDSDFLLDAIADESANVMPKILDHEARKRINLIFGRLTPRHELILRLLTGMGDSPEEDTTPLTKAEIARKLGVSRERVSQLRKSSLNNIVKNGDLRTFRDLLRQF